MAGVVINNIEITDEIRSRLYNYAPIKPENEIWYIPEAYRDLPEAIRAEFRLKSAGGVDKLRCQDEFRGGLVYGSDGEAEGVQLNRGAFTIALCRGRVLGWKKYYNLETGEEIAYDSTLQCIGHELLHELGNVILSPEFSQLSKEECLGLK